MAALGEALPPDGPQWPHALSAPGHVGLGADTGRRKPPFTTSSVASLTPPVPRNERTAVIHVLATMAMSALDRRTP